MLCGLTLLGCGSTAQRLADDAQYAEAERAFSGGDTAEAVRLFEARSGGEDAALAWYRLGQLHERAGRATQAVAAFQKAAKDKRSPERAALARFQLALRDDAPCDALLRVAAEAPNRAAADRAVRQAAAQCADSDGAALTLIEAFGALHAQHPQTDVADNVLWWRSTIQLRRLGDLGGARQTLAQLVRAHPDSPLLDDALWRWSAILRRQGAAAEAIEVLSALVRRRSERSYIVGTYRSSLLDDAWLALGWIHYHQGAFAEAEAAFKTLMEESPGSTLVDDARWGQLNAIAQQRGDAVERARSWVDDIKSAGIRRKVRTFMERGVPVAVDPSQIAAGLDWQTL